MQVSPLYTLSEYLLMEIEVVDIEKIVEFIQISFVIFIGKRVAESKVYFLALALE
jgi:hypothetical protein